MTRHVAILGTGGTIAGLAAGCEQGYASAQRSVDALIREALDGHPTLPWQAEQVVQLDSKDMQPQAWQALALRCRMLLAEDAVAGIVITHGTDTLEETAWLLACVLEARKPVVLTCAMRPWDDPAPDGPGNLRDALSLAQMPGAQGVMVCVQGQALAAGQVIKAYARRDAAFACDLGMPVAQRQAEGWVLQGSWPQALGSHAPAVTQGRLTLETLAADWPWIEILVSRAGVQPRLPQLLHDAGARGVVIAATGMGTVHQDWVEPLQQFVQQGWPVVVAGRCPFEPLDAWAAQGLPMSPVRSPFKAAISLALDVLASAAGVP